MCVCEQESVNRMFQSVLRNVHQQLILRELWCARACGSTSSRIRAGRSGVGGGVCGGGECAPAPARAAILTSSSFLVNRVRVSECERESQCERESVYVVRARRSVPRHQAPARASIFVNCVRGCGGRGSAPHSLWTVTVPDGGRGVNV